MEQLIWHIVLQFQFTLRFRPYNTTLRKYHEKYGRGACSAVFRLRRAPVTNRCTTKKFQVGRFYIRPRYTPGRFYIRPRYTPGKICEKIHHVLYKCSLLPCFTTSLRCAGHCSALSAATALPPRHRWITRVVLVSGVLLPRVLLLMAGGSERRASVPSEAAFCRRRRWRVGVSEERVSRREPPFVSGDSVGCE